jgi:dTMP kinase
MVADSPRGRFITIEGIEGVGKSTNLAWVAERLRKQRLEVVITREPGGTPLAERIRGLLLDSAPGSVPETCELLLMFAARASHLQALIRPALARGAWVVCDRFTDATYAYQGTGRGMSADWIAALEQMVQGDLRPDLTLLLDATPALTSKRRHARGVMDRFEAEDEAFFERVASGYRQRAAADAQRFRVIDASLPLPAVQKALGKALDSYLESI